MPLFFLVLLKYILSPKRVTPVLQGLSPWVNQFSYTHSTETETHIYFRLKSAETFDLPSISRQQGYRLHMGRDNTVNVETTRKQIYPPQYTGTYQANYITRVKQ